MESSMEKLGLPAVAPPEEPLNPDRLDEKPEEATSISGSSTRRDGDITENENPDATVAAEPKAEQGEEDEHEWITGIPLTVVMACVTLVCYLMFLDGSIIVTAIPQITNDFQSLQDVGWYGSAYQLASASIQPLTGKIYTHFSTKWSFLAFFFIFEVGSLICGVAPSSTALIVGRAVAGLGVSGLMNGALTIVAGSVPLAKRPGLIGILMGLSQFGLISGPLIGGALTEYATWRWCFYINLPIGGLVAILLVIAKVPDQIVKPQPRSVVPKLHEFLDLVGAGLIAVSAVQLLLALQFGGNQHPWKSATVIGLFCGSGATFVVWCFWNRYKGDEALIPFSLVKMRTVWSSALTGMFFFGTVFTATYFLPIYFQAVKGATPFLSGVYMLPSILSQLVFAVSSGILLSKLGYYLPWSVAGSILTSIGVGLFSTFSPTTTTGEWIGYQVIVGSGRGMSIQMPFIAIQSVLPDNQISIATSLLVFAQYLGSAVFLTLANTIFGTSMRHELATQAPDVNAGAILAAGATAFRGFISPADLPGVLSAYAASVDRVFYLAIGLGCAMFVCSWGLGWVDIRKKRQAGKGEA